jgi:DNA-binding PadR family transcriptional regulator
VLVAIAAAGGEPVAPVQLQKSLFLLGKELPGEVGADFFKFKPYHFGPFSATIYQDAERLEAAGLVRIDREEPGRSWALYMATQAGLDVAAAVAKTKSQRAVQYLRAAVQWARGLSFTELVSAIYRRYPEQRVNSVFNG